VLERRGASVTAQKISLFEPDLGPKESSNVLAVLESGWVALGDQVASFEKQFAEYTGARCAVALNSGTAALHLAYLLAGVRPGDEVIVPSLTFCATVNAVIYCGATPVFADIRGADDWTLDPDDVAKRITPKTRAVAVMHYGGYPCDMIAFENLCRDAEITLIEDAAHGLGGTIAGRPLGTLGALGCFSFYSNKVITTVEGGMLVTDDEALATRARRLRSHGMTATAVDRRDGSQGYDVTEVGFNYRLDDLRAALGLAQMERLETSLTRRRALVAHYRERLADLPNLHVPDHGGRGKSAHYIMPVLLERARRAGVREQLQELGVQTSVHYAPVHQFEHYRSFNAVLPRTDAIASNILTLPLYPSMTGTQVDRVCDVLAQALASAD
jgi:dTDP-4-amino-4,6-dideoxygalactose transaminase